MTVIENEKALRYIGLLDHARLNGSWGEIQELARKVNKHAPHRSCLTLTATSEAAIATTANQRPSTASSVASGASYAGLLDVTPKLVQAVDQEKTYFEDAFQANVCLHEVYFMRGEWKTIVGDLEGDVWQQVAQHTKNPLDISPNTRVAILKNRYFLGVAQEHLDDYPAAATSYQSALKAVQNVPEKVASASEYRAWAERILGRVCLLHTQHGDPNTLTQANLALSAFRSWSRFWDQSPARSATQSSPASLLAQRRDVWGRYYKLLSSILASHLVYSSSSSTLLSVPDEDMASEELVRVRLQQRAEIKRVETAYETLILQETRFPKASQTNEEVENWVHQAIENWLIFCGPRWREADLGEGGKVAISRSMLDILYRAATKTFHSTPILRNLFNVHASLAEFDLAMRAFDTYSEIISRGKSRAEKTGEHEPGLDSDDQVMLTAAQAVSVLCKYGSRPEAEKALDIGRTLSAWLQQQRPPSVAPTTSHTRSASTSERAATESLLSRPALAATYRAIGQSQANWARLTYETSQRKDLQVKALSSLRRASELASPPGSDPDTCVLLATILAESRDFIAAIQVLKKGLALASQSQDNEDDSVSGDPESVTREQKMAPMWHLLSLLLTARGEFENAVKVCEAAFEQLNGSDLFDADGPPGSEEKHRPTSASSQVLIDQMEDSVKESLIQTRVTQLALIEVLESPAAAADASSSLLALYHKLFGSISAGTPAPVHLTAPTTAPPKTGGPLKSMTGSILGRSRTGRKSIERTTHTSTGLSDDSTAGAAMSTQSTNDNLAEKQGKHHHHIPHHPFKLRGHHGDWREVGNLKQQQPPTLDGNNPNGSATGQEAPSGEQPLRQIPHNIDHQKEPPPLGHSDQPPEQDIRLPAPHPAASVSLPPRFPSPQQRRQNISLLIDIWLFIAGQYVRSELFEDAEGSIEEAYKLVEGFQDELAKENCSARAFDERGWGGGKSVNRLWADVYAERATLAAARDRPYEALNSFEQSLSHFPDHPVAVVGISSILLDIYEEKIAPEANPLNLPAPATKITTTTTPSTSTASSVPPSPAQLNRLTARDRAYMLLNTLSKLGEGWDDSETWAMLARAHELSGQIDRAKECLWWVVELEDARPIRPWGVVGV